jgi:signal transduction histidine kinase
MILSLQKRLTLTFTLFTAAVLGILALGINLFTAAAFNALIRENINAKSGEIVRAIGDLYDPLEGGFDGLSVEAMGMYFVHDGYIVTVEDGRGDLVWDARACDMQQCAEVINDISFRMEGGFRLNGGMRKQGYPVYYNGGIVGTVNIETYGPFFYSETETQFLRSINRFLLITGLILTLAGAGISTLLSRSIAEPVLEAGKAARRIAQVHAPWTAPGTAGGLGTAPAPGTEGGGDSGDFIIRINDGYNTRELRDLSRSINELAAELEEGERRQKQLTADIAHELRTPLTCLQGDLEAMIDGVYAPDREHLESCREELLRLISLVKDLNTLTSLEWEKIELTKTTFDLAELLRGTAEQFRAAAAEKGIEIKLDLRESFINADYGRLKQVFMNILSNAVKYTEGGSITIAVSRAAGPAGEASSAGRWEVSVADTGAGIPEGDIPHIFERFYRGDKSRSRSTGGAGIGLAVAAAIVRAHGGTIGARSGGPAAGTLFRVAL